MNAAGALSVHHDGTIFRVNVPIESRLVLQMQVTFGLCVKYIFVQGYVSLEQR